MRQEQLDPRPSLPPHYCEVCGRDFGNERCASPTRCAEEQRDDDRDGERTQQREWSDAQVEHARAVLECGGREPDDDGEEPERHGIVRLRAGWSGR